MSIRPHAGRLAGMAAAGFALVSIAFPASADARFGDRTLRSGMSGHDVRVLQSWLTHLGLRTEVDGNFGRGTVKSLRRFERKEKLAVNGRLEKRDARRMRSRLRQKVSSGGTSFESGPVGKARLSADGRTAVPPSDAPQQVKDAILAANKIIGKPYKYGGGHGDFEDSGYDCSGTISYALHGGGLLDRPLDSTGFMSWGASGRGKWITIYAHGGHAYVVIAGLRLDTSGTGGRGPGWHRSGRSSGGYTIRHPRGL